MTSFRTIRNGLFGMAVAGALGFGGTQLMATPALSSTATSCAEVPCELEACDLCCQALVTGPLTSGYCGPEGQCLCAF